MDGIIGVQEALQKAKVREIFMRQGLEDTQDLDALAHSLDVPLWRVEAGVIASLSEAVTPQGVVAVVEDPSVDLEAIGPGADLIVAIGEVRDPGNAGTLVRSAAAVDADAVVFISGTVDPLHPKVVRSSAGALFGVPIVRDVTFEETIDHLHGLSIKVLGAQARAPTPVDAVDLTTPIAIVLGNEAWGLPVELRDALDEVVGIPMPGSVESLNVAVAGSIFLFEAVRQRRAPSPRAT